MKLIKYSAQWCQPCKNLAVNLKTIDLSGIELEEVDVDSVGKDALMQAKVRSIPTLVLLSDDGTELRRKSGAMTTEQLKEFLDN